ncbi:copper homeostasis membrane protein CopD [Sphingopyxis sp.]|uniref:copper homeostasis membrane protein CopD n=1 Tax=Sphingopyxis sp. TaxID=1908224 RepID=UPI002D79C4ED|nr:copper homeostasis membrane protein CopD [Sphingopyxis sp.]HET6526974.1 copper homeostasis membrane protein CopD [Sphingopyxis sp.]
MTDSVLIGVRFALYADLMLLVGLAAFPFHALRREERRDPQVVEVLFAPQFWLASLGLIASLIGMVALTASMQGVTVFAVDPAMLVMLIGETDVGAAWIVRLAALGTALAAASQLGRRPAAAAATIVIAGSAALATLVWAGHAGASEGLTGAIHRLADAAHMIAAAIWFGAIAAILILLRPGDGIAEERLALTARSLDRFASTGTVCVLVIAATGLVNAQIIVGANNIGRAVASSYGQLLGVKLLFFALMLALAAANRWRLTPALSSARVEGDPAAALRAMRRSLAIEILAATAILALVAWLGMLEPLPV